LKPQSSNYSAARSRIAALMLLAVKGQVKKMAEARLWKH